MDTIEKAVEETSDPIKKKAGRPKKPKSIDSIMKKARERTEAPVEGKAVPPPTPVEKREDDPDYKIWGKMCEDTFTNARGQEHGFIESIANAVADHGFSGMAAPQREKMLDLKKKMLKPQKFKYQNLKNQETGKFEGWYYTDWPGEPQRFFRLLHNHSYTLPWGLKMKMDKMGSPKRAGLVGTDGHPLTSDGEIDQTHQLIPVMDY